MGQGLAELQIYRHPVRRHSRECSQAPSPVDLSNPWAKRQAETVSSVEWKKKASDPGRGRGRYQRACRLPRTGAKPCC